MCAIVSAAAYAAANQADPKIPLGSTNATCIFDVFCGRQIASKSRNAVVLGVAADRTATAPPFFKTSTVKDVLTEDDQKASCLVHTF
jgi:hypothetical protein